jgi:hypothetical protein
MKNRFEAFAFHKCNLYRYNEDVVVWMTDVVATKDEAMQRGAVVGGGAS